MVWDLGTLGLNQNMMMKKAIKIFLPSKTFSWQISVCALFHKALESLDNWNFLDKRKYPIELDSLNFELSKKAVCMLHLL